MRINLLIIGFFLVINVYGQGRYSYVFDAVSVNDALQLIEEENEIQIYCLDDWIKGQKLDGNFYGETIKHLLDNTLGDIGLSAVQYDEFSYILIREMTNGQTVEQITKDGRIIRKIVLGDLVGDIQHAKISGFINDAETGQPLFGSTVLVNESNQGTTTDVNGYFELNLPVGEHKIEVSNVGYNNDQINAILQSDAEINISLVSDSNTLEEVVIKGIREKVSESEAQSRNIVTMETIKYVPALMGEKDIVKSIELLPGINSTGEGANGYSVRGGNAGQNLIILEDAPLYNSSHLFGLFSVFNPGLVESAIIYKGALPAYYGGRVSSVMDVGLKNGLNKKWDGEIGIGLLTSRMHLEGLISQKLSLVTGARISYVDRFLKKFNNADVREGSGGFYDVNIKSIYDHSEKDTFIFNGFTSRDDFTLPTGDDIFYGNRLFSAKWNRKHSEEIVSDFSLSYSNYYSSISSGDSLQTREVDNNISSFSTRANLTFYTYKNHTLNAGIENIFTNVNPGKIQQSNSLDSTSTQIEEERAIESALYVSDEIVLNERTTLSVGLRVSGFFQLGPGTEFFYQENEPKRVSTISNSFEYGSGEIMESYIGLEPRIFFNHTLSSNTTLKLNVGRSRQYLYLVSNSASVSPLSIWKLSDAHLKPQVADQVAIGLSKTIGRKAIELTTEVFYRKIKNLPDYKNGAELLTNQNLERALVSGTGRAYGLEFQLLKKYGRLSGWLAYAYVRSQNRMNSTIRENRINEGEIYSSDNDRPHSISASGDYLLTRLWSLSFNWVYTSGRPMSIPNAIYYHDQMQVAYYSNRNEYRIPDYHRLDLSLNWKGTSLKIKKKWDVNWSVALYNVYGRANAYSIFFERDRDRLQGKKLTILSDPVPSVSCIIKF